MKRFQRQVRRNAMGSSLIAAKVVWIAVFLAVVAAVTHSHSTGSAAAAVRALNADLLAHDSATEVLGRWCASHHLADPPVIRALRDKMMDKPADRQIRALLRAAPGEVVGYRHVRLTCGEHVLSQADNWYLPARLTPEMNRQLDQTDTPFGLVVKPLNFHRRRIEARVLTSGVGGKAQPYVLRHRAVLTTDQGAPFSVVVERYTREIMN